MPYNILPRAEEDLEAIGDYIAEDNPARALTFIQEFRETFSQLAAMPKSAPSRPRLGPNIRMRPVGNYIIYYRPTDEGIEVVRVLHSARDINSDQFYQ